MSIFNFKIADCDDEFEAIHRLNYRTFVEEIPQHQPNEQRRLVDPFHHENTYAVCKVDHNIVGMIAGRAQRPFSLDKKLDNLDALLPAHSRPVEVRLLAVEPRYRRSRVFAQLVHLLAKHFAGQGHDLALISATLRQRRLYQHMGFTPFGPQVGSAEAPYQPMYLDIQAYTRLARSLDKIDQHTTPPVNLLPGPVAVSSAVKKAFSGAAISHRSDRFISLHQQAVEQLCRMTQAQHVLLMSGSGTHANDAIAAQLSASKQRGLVLSNGEFGERLLDHARRWQLDHLEHRQPWGTRFNTDTLIKRLEDHPDVGWIWLVACETSTGIHNPWEALSTYCHTRGIHLCLDAVSALGTTPMQLAQVRFASGVSGKAIGAYAGIACVFHNGAPLAPPQHLPRALDLALYQKKGGIPFTLSSNLLSAFTTALTQTNWTEKYKKIARVSAKLRQQLVAEKIDLLTTEADQSAVITLPLPEHINSVALCRELESHGFLLSAESDYLIQRHWIQICLFGEFDEQALYRLPKLLVAALRKQEHKNHSGPQTPEHPPQTGGV